MGLECHFEMYTLMCCDGYQGSLFKNIGATGEKPN